MKLSLEINETITAQYAQLVLDCIEREYPNSNLYWFDSDEDERSYRGGMIPVQLVVAGKSCRNLSKGRSFSC